MKTYTDKERAIIEAAIESERDSDSGPEAVVYVLPNGREIRREGGGFVVQPRNDSTWITVGTIEEAMDVYFGRA